MPALTSVSVQIGDHCLLYSCEGMLVFIIMLYRYRFRKLIATGGVPSHSGDGEAAGCVHAEVSFAPLPEERYFVRALSSRKDTLISSKHLEVCPRSNLPCSETPPKSACMVYDSPYKYMMACLWRYQNLLCMFSSCHVLQTPQLAH